MAGSRLSLDGFEVIMKNLRKDEKFRRQLLSDNPARATIGKSIFLKEDIHRIAAIRWNQKGKHNNEIDEKLVLCSSSGY